LPAAGGGSRSRWDPSHLHH